MKLICRCGRELTVENPNKNAISGTTYCRSCDLVFEVKVINDEMLEDEVEETFKPNRFAGSIWGDRP